VAVQHDRLVQELRDVARPLPAPLDDLDIVRRLERPREAQADVAAARDHDAAYRIVELAHLAQHAADVLARGDEEDLVAFLDDGIAVRDDAAPASIDRDDAALDARH